MRLICIMSLILLLSSCSSIPSKVYIPTYCDVQKREKPQKSGDLLEDIKKILIYSELLEQDLEFCRGKKGE